MKEISSEIIEIDGKEYKLFLNRKGIATWEKYTREDALKINEFQKKYTNSEIEEDLDKVENPFEEADEIQDNYNAVKNTFIKLYWIMLYENHKLKYSEVKSLFEKACEEYGENSIIDLANQMVEECIQGPNKKLKKLKALKPKKK